MPEFGKCIVVDQGFKNFKENDEIAGFQVRVRISYYRGIALSLLEGYKVEADGVTYTNDDISFSLDGEHFTPVKALGTMSDVRWEFGDKAYLHVRKPGGLARGRHKIRVTQMINVPYLPFSTKFYQEQVMTIV